jgi:hypothetical protein
MPLWRILFKTFAILTLVPGKNWTGTWFEGIS